MLKKYRITDKAGITCDACIATIEGAIEPLIMRHQLARKYRVDLDTKSLTLFDLPVGQAENIKAEIKQAVQAVGYFEECQWEEITEAENFSDTAEQKTITPYLIKGLASIVMGALWMGLPFLPGVFRASASVLGLAIVSTLIIAYAGWEIFMRALTAAKRGQLKMDTQFSVSVLVALVISWMAFRVTSFSFLFDAGLLILGFRHLGLAIKEWAKRKIDLGHGLLDGLPKTVDVIDSGGEQKAIDALIAGDKISVPPGVTIPVDGICLSEHAVVMAPDISGQTDRFVVQKNDKLLQGYQVVGSRCVEMSVEKSVSQSTLADTQHQVKNAATQRMGSMSITQRIGTNFVKGVFVLTLCAFAFVALYAHFVLDISTGIAFTLALKTGLGVLVIACPCAFGFIIPLIGKVGTDKCFKEGATLLDAHVLENTAKAKHIVFDINGTLTDETVVEQLVILDEKLLPDKIPAYLKFLEEKSQHVVGQAIYSFLEQTYPQENLTAAEINVFGEIADYGMGLGVKIQGQEFIIGNQDLLAHKKIVLNPNKFSKIPPMTQRHYIVYGAHVIGYMDVIQKIRPEALAVLEYFRAQKMGVTLCTGMARESAMPYATALGFKPSEVIAGCHVKTNRKVDHLNALTGPAIFVGEGGNDTAVIAAAAVGIVVDSPTMNEASKTGAKAYVRGRSLLPLVKMHAIAKQTVFSIKLSVGFSLLYNLAAFIFMGGFALFKLGFMMNPGLGAAIMVGQSVVVLMFAAVFRLWPVSDQFSSHAEAKVKHVAQNNPALLGGERWTSTPSRRLSSEASLIHLPSTLPEKGFTRGSYKIPPPTMTGERLNE